MQLLPCSREHLLVEPDYPEAAALWGSPGQMERSHVVLGNSVSQAEPLSHVRPDAQNLVER